MTLSDIVAAARRQLPNAKIMPLFKSKDGLRPAFNCYKKDWGNDSSTGREVGIAQAFDWDGDYTDTNTASGESFDRRPAWYAVCGCREYVIIDIDNKNGHDANTSINRLIEQGLNIDTFTVSTKSGGYHLYYQNPGYDVKTMANYIPGVDIRGRGGYVVGFTPEGFKDKYNYLVINETEPAALTIPLPMAGTKHSLPSIQDMQLSITPDYEQMALIPMGLRDQALLALSGKWYDLPDAEIAVKFKTLNFQQVPGDEITLDHLMAKIARDRAKTSKQTLEVAEYLLNRFVYVTNEDMIYDLQENVLKTVPDMQNFYPASITFMEGEKVRSIPQIRFWLTHPNRVTARARRFKPGAPKLFTSQGDMYINTYIAPKIKPWQLPVKADDEELSEFMQVVDLITNYNPVVKDLYLSQRAAKLQNPLWTPSWGFVLISHHMQVGKDLTAHIFGMLLGSQYCRTIKKYDLVNDRQEYNYEKLFVVLNEPGGLARGQKGLETVELLKEFMSSRKGTSRMLYQNTSEEAPIYKVPEIHSNLADSFEITEDRARYAPIIITGKPLDISVYARLKLRQDDEDINCSFYRKLLRFLLDYPVNKEIHELTPPLMPDSKEVKVISRSGEYQDVLEHIENSVGMFYSVMQTHQSLDLAIATHITHGNMHQATALRRKLIKDNVAKQYARCRAIPRIEYDKTNISSEVARITKLPTPNTQMVAVYNIKEIPADRVAKTHAGTVDLNFFPK